jgi:hypothetical protein
MAQMLTAPMQSLSYVRNGTLCRRYVDVLVGLFGQNAPLPYEMVGRLSEAFGYRRGDKELPKELARLQEAMADHLARLQGNPDKYYINRKASSPSTPKAARNRCCSIPVWKKPPLSRTCPAIRHGKFQKA